VSGLAAFSRSACECLLAAIPMSQGLLTKRSELVFAGKGGPNSVLVV
jgi:hypothetical protein